LSNGFFGWLFWRFFLRHSCQYIYNVDFKNLRI
jgi:hypothetical protein